MRKMLIDGQLVESLAGETFAVENPATEEQIDEVPRARAADADRAVLAAVKAQDDWRFVPGIEKCELLHGVARNLREHQRELATLLTEESAAADVLEGSTRTCGRQRRDHQAFRAYAAFYTAAGRDCFQ